MSGSVTAFGNPLLSLLFWRVQKSHLKRVWFSESRLYWEWEYFLLSVCLQVWKATSHPLLWHHWHLPAGDPPPPTVHHHVTAPPALIGPRAHWVDRPILWIPFLSRFLTRLIIPVCLEKRAPGDPAVCPPSAGTADPPMDTLVRKLADH